MTSTPTIAIRAQNLTRHFGAIKALDALNVDVPSGIIFGFLGPNGSGKTTTINLLLGLLAPTSGTAQVLGYDSVTQGEDVRTRTGALLEHPGLYEQMSAEDNLEFYARVWRMPSADRQARINELLSGMGVWERRKDRVGTWSRGMRQKLAIARALVHRPSLVFLDEPTAGLDVMAANDVREGLAKMVANEGTTVFLTTHNMTEAERLCSKVAVIREGKLLAVGHPNELRARAGSPHVEIVGSGFTDSTLALLQARPEVTAVDHHDDHLAISLREETDTTPLVAILIEGGAKVEEVRKGQASLEDAFLTLMHDEPGSQSGDQA